MRIIFAALALFSGFLHANSCTPDGCKGKATNIIERMYVSGYSDGRVIIKPKVSTQSLDCTLIEGQFLTLHSNHVLFEEIYSGLLTSIATNKEIFIRIKNKTNNCEVSYIMMWT